MPLISTRRFTPNNLPRDSAQWGREVESRIQDLESAAQRGSLDDTVVNKGQDSSINLVTRSLATVDLRIATALSTATFDASRITTGQFSSARYAGNSIPAGALSGTVSNDVSSNNVVANNVQGTNLYDLNVATNITAARVAVWGQTSNGFIATASSSEKLKTNIEPANWPIEKLEAVAEMVSVYYQWIAAVEAHKLDPSVQVHTEIGYIAERMHEAGLWEFVVYERNQDDSLAFDADHFEATKERVPIPLAIHYQNWAIAVHAVVQYLWRARKGDRADIDMILGHLGLHSTVTA
jgi:hypothetical protein